MNDSNSEYSEHSDSEDQTDEDVAYAEPKARWIKSRVNVVFNEGTPAKNIKWVACLMFKDKAQVKATVRAFSVETGRPLKYRVKTVNNEHNCVYHYNNKLVTVKYLAELYGNRIRRNPSWKLKEMQEEFKKELKIEVGEAKCCRVRQRALSQVHEEMVKHFAGLRRFSGKFYGATKITFTVIGGQMLSAVGRDGNDSMFPITIEVVESGSYSSWSWFLLLLINDLDLRSGSGYTLISDQQKGLDKVVREFLPQVEHKFCARHLRSNLIKKEANEAIKLGFWAASTATFLEAFKIAMKDLENHSKRL
ncbi:uncharacterized protein LOC141700423 [Apium graveolens]|uniref:uncharacterized protein LOC141700423 n=1 Tax=Apium graveolens TaxID=4045 RepID=UPI003D7A8EE3